MIELSKACVSIPAFDEQLYSEAEALLQGKLYFGVQQRFVDIGFENVDWAGTAVAHHNWKSLGQRFIWLQALLSAFQEQPKPEYASTARNYIADWIKAHPNREGWVMADYDNGLNLAIRVMWWFQCAETWKDQESWDEKFLETFWESVTCQLNFIQAHLSPKGNFRICQAMCLLEASLRKPELSDAKVWSRKALVVLNDASKRQILKDGVHVEASPNYHSWMMSFFSLCMIWKKDHPHLNFKFGREEIEKMYRYSLAATKPNGSFCGILDCEGIYEGQQEDVFWLKYQEFCESYGVEAQRPSTSAHFTTAQQSFCRSDWSFEAEYLGFEGTRWGSAHGHLSKNALQFHANDRSLLVDPGRLQYEMSNPLGPYGKSTVAHNTMNLNGWNQNTTNVDRYQCFTSPQADCMISSYSGGYWPGTYGWWFADGLGKGIAAVHTRCVYYVHGRFTMVVDRMMRWNEQLEGMGEEHLTPRLEQNWQFAPGEIACDEQAGKAWTKHKDSNVLLMFPKMAEGSIFVVYEGQREPMRGWVRSPDRYDGIPAPQLSVQVPKMESFDDTCVSLLVPFVGEEQPELKAKVSCVEGGRQQLLLKWSDGTEDLIWWRQGMEEMIGDTPEGLCDGILYHKCVRDDQVVYSTVDGELEEKEQVNVLSEVSK